ncbi:RNA polymerase sigma factor for flagellar operon [Pandoraea eparura]|uniref:RNA polymerase sigma factor for flagellar operon n=1 Tax=Pandoraea eparura TaxID=2508291 RepID=A0A5E4VFL7_9BURK|nr:FliA/WhiG family RNA polymerase sigma factor [Pandoraea eparura]VVE10139.1 RNA polymerase sigma factor for flagellar operon [Pandoraea eparura]
MNTLMYGPVMRARDEPRDGIRDEVSNDARAARGIHGEGSRPSRAASPHASLPRSRPPSPSAWPAMPVADEQAHVLRLMPVIARIVRSLAPQTNVAMAQEDMTQIALIAALDAIRRYGPQDERFIAYAATRIRGAVLDELRRLDWRPRTLRQASHRRRDAERELTRRLGRAPTREELRDHAGMDAASLEEAEMASYAESIASFDQLLAEGGMAANEALVERRSPEDLVAARQSLARSLDALDAREQRVVQLYYEFDMNLEEIGEVLGLTRARICQIHQAALAKMRLAMHDAGRSGARTVRASQRNGQMT